MPVQTTELVDLPKIAPVPPVARMTASAGKVRTSMERRSMAQMPRQTPVRVEHRGEKFPELVLRDLAFGLVAAHLLVERVEKLLAGGGAGEGGAVVERAAEAAEVEQPFGRAVEGHAHAVEQVDDAGRGFAHGLDRRLVGEEVAAVDGVVEVLPGGVAFALEILGGVDAALRADRVRALHRHDGEQIDVPAHLGDLDDGGKSGQAAADHYNFRIVMPSRLDSYLSGRSLFPGADRASKGIMRAALRADRLLRRIQKRAHGKRSHRDEQQVRWRSRRSRSGAGPRPRW